MCLEENAQFSVTRATHTKSIVNDVKLLHVSIGQQ